ncbi:MAG: hypothetical protein ACFCUX_00435 [Candidatus Methylacidiphilales bacterium]
MFEKSEFSAPSKKTPPASAPEQLPFDTPLPLPGDISRELVEYEERLVALKRQEEELESRKRELEELSRRRNELFSGKKTMREHLTRAITLLERAELDTQREIETIRSTRQTFKEHLADIEAIDPKSWEPEEMDEQLTRSLSIVDHAQSAFSQARLKLESISGRIGHNEILPQDEYEESADSDSPPFFELLRRGLAFSLPLMILLAAIAFLLLTRR